MDEEIAAFMCGGLIMSVFVEFLDKLPSKNQIAVGQMLNELSEDAAGFIEDYLLKGSDIPGNIVESINQAFISAGYPQFTWQNCQTDTSRTRFDSWFDEIE